MSNDDAPRIGVYSLKITGTNAKPKVECSYFSASPTQIFEEVKKVGTGGREALVRIPDNNKSAGFQKHTGQWVWLTSSKL